MTADKAYDSQTARQQIKDEGALPIIPNRRNAIKQAYCPKRFYRQRHKIEDFFCRIFLDFAHCPRRVWILGPIREFPKFWMGRANNGLQHFFMRGALGEGRCFAHQSLTRSALIVSFGPTMRLTA